MKRLFLLFLLLLSIASLASCSDSNKPAAAEDTQPVVLASDGEIYYAVMRKEIATREETDAAVAIHKYLLDALPERTRVRVTNDIDYQYMSIPEGTKYIIVGDCVYTGDDGTVYAAAAGEGLAEDEYGIHVFADGTITVLAGSQRNYAAAAEFFISCLSADGGTVTFTPPEKAVLRRVFTQETNPPYDVVDIDRDENAPSDLPALYITLDGGTRLSSVNKDEWTRATIALDGLDLMDDVTEKAGFIKGRGNYSWSLPKKPYNFKFDEKVNLCGLGWAKKWTLIANYSDKTLLRNYLTLSFALDAGMAYTSECAPVNLYVNGEYEGLYLLTEKVQVHENRVNIDTAAGAMLFEIEMKYRHSEALTHLTSREGVHMMLVEPEVDLEHTDEDIKAATERLNTIVNKAESAMRKGYEYYKDAIDVDAFINWYIVSEFVKNYDSIFVTSVYGYIDNDGRLALGPVWDFDTCMGNQEVATCINPVGWYIRDATWYDILFRDETFASLVAERWRELRDGGVISAITERIDAFVAEHGESIDANFKEWPTALRESGLRGRKSLYTYEEEVEYLKDWISKRTAWLDEQFGYTEG